jgi:hypothetical protein
MTQQSSLAPVAQEVSVYLREYYEKFWRKPENMEATIVELANKIIEKDMDGVLDVEELAAISIKVKEIEADLLMQEREKQSALPEENRTKKGEVIIKNFSKKLLATLKATDAYANVAE